MTGTAFPIDADTTSGAPAFTGQDSRQAFAALMAPEAGRPIGARSGIRPGNDPTVTVDSASWTVTPFVGVADPDTALDVGPYLVAFPADETGTVNAADASNPRVDRLDVQVPDDPPGAEPRDAVIVYTAGSPAASPVAPAAPARSFPLGTISVPAAGAGSPSFSAAWPYVVALGGVIPTTGAGQRPSSPYRGQLIDDPSKGLMRWDGSKWVQYATQASVNAIPSVPKVAAGAVDVNNTAINQTFSANVTFPAGLFSAAPAVTLAQTGPNPDRASVSVGNITATGCTVYAYRTVGSVITTVQWIAAENAP